MQLIPLDTSELIHRAAGWLAAKENAQWLDFGDGGQRLTPALVKIMAQRDTNVLRLFTADDDVTPIGVVGFNTVDRSRKTATLWIVLGDKSYARQGYATRAVSALLSLGFHELGLEAISTWVVDRNPSLQIAVRLNLRFIGRQRQCHHIDGQACDRLWFDILASEHREPAVEMLPHQTNGTIDRRRSQQTDDPVLGRQAQAPR